MPGVSNGAPSQAFHRICERWVQGLATPFDTAVLTSLTTSTPIPSTYDDESIKSIGFLITTRQPPPATTHLFHSAKNSIREKFHRNSSDAARTLIVHSLTTDDEPNNKIEFPITLASTPFTLGLLSAIFQAIGNDYTISWIVKLPNFISAGLQFCHAVKQIGFIPIVDLENDLVIWKSSEDMTDTYLTKIAIKLKRIGSDDVIPAGKVEINGGELRNTNTKSTLIPRLLLKARIAIGTHHRHASSLLIRRIQNKNRLQSYSLSKPSMKRFL